MFAGKLTKNIIAWMETGMCLHQISHRLMLILFGLLIDQFRRIQMKFYKIFLVLMTSVMMLSYSHSHAQEDSDDPGETTIENMEADMNGALNGSITSDGKTLAGAVITLSGGETDLQLVTTDNGWFQFVDVEPGDYQLTVTAEGYESETSDVKIESGDSNKVNMKLKAK